MLLVATLSDQIALSFLLKGDMYGVRGLNFGLVTFSDPEVTVGAIGSDDGKKVKVKQTRIESSELGVADAIRLLATWIAIAKLPFYRLVWNGGVALYGADQVNRWVYDDRTDQKNPLDEISPKFTAPSEWVYRFIDELRSPSAEAA